MRSDRSSGGGVDRRLHSYAPHPYESVGHPGLITTLFPHLGQRRAHDFRITLIAGLVLISILYALGFVSAALLASAVLVPILYLLYLHDSGLSRDEPLAVIGLTLGSGAGLGVLNASPQRSYCAGVRWQPTPHDGQQGRLYPGTVGR